MSVILPLGEFSPDLAAFNNTGMTRVMNVVPLTPKSYGPIPSLQRFSGNASLAPIPALPSAPYGLFSFLDRHGAEHIFAGTATKLYEYKTGDAAFRDVSGVTSHYRVDTVHVASGGNSYTVRDIISLTWATSGTPASFYVDTVGPALFHAESASVPVGAGPGSGTGYTALDVLTVSGGTFTTATTMTVQTVNGTGKILTASFTAFGDYSVIPSNPVTFTGGTGTGATWDLDWATDPTSREILTLHVLDGGDYTSAPNSPCDVIGGTGDNATLNTTSVVSSSDAKVYHASAYNNWNFVSFGNSVIAVNSADPPQVMDLDNDDQFRDLNTTRAPFAKFVCVAKNFLIMANVTECADGVEYPSRLHWSAIADGSTWPDIGSDAAAQLQSDSNDLRSDLGHITAIGSNLQNADMIILMNDGCYAARYSGSPTIFNFEVVQGAVGCRVPGSLVIHRGYAYYKGPDGFVAFDGVVPSAIGANKIDKFFSTDADPNFLYKMRGSADPTGRLIIWSYVSNSSEDGEPDMCIIYNWSLGQWSIASIKMAWLGKGLTTGYSMSQLTDPPFGTSEEITPSLDDPYWQGGKPYLLAFNTDFQVCSFSGPNLAAMVETTEGQPSPSKRSRVTGARPLVDGGIPIVTVGYRNRQEDAVVYAAPVVMNAWGETSQRVDARYFRGRIEIPAGALWQHILGIDLSFSQSTYR